MPEETAPDTQHSALITSHKYRPPKGEPWGLCATCGMGQASHKSAGKRGYKPKTTTYRCPDCVTKGVDPCPHLQKK